MFVCPLGYPEGKYGSGEDPRRERHQTEEPVREFLADERSGGCSGLKGPNCRHDETGGLNGELEDPFLLVFPCWLTGFVFAGHEIHGRGGEKHG